jgi:hypothetical protein
LIFSGAVKRDDMKPMSSLAKSAVAAAGESRCSIGPRSASVSVSNNTPWRNWSVNNRERSVKDVLLCDRWNRRKSALKTPRRRK